MQEHCTICPRNCNVNRNQEMGFCNAPNELKINIYQLHHGEEPIISGSNGSGTIFFSHCNLKCVFCQNYLISYFGYGKKYSITELSSILLDLQNKKAHNINLVSPTQYTLSIIESIKIAKDQGLTIPIIWNSNAYENKKTIQLLDKHVNIFLPDFKYWNEEKAFTYSGIKNYPHKAKDAIKEMFYQSGEVKIKDGIIQKGTIIRLLILPENISEIEKIMEWISINFGKSIYVSLMGQYYPTHLAFNYPETARGITTEEYKFATRLFNQFEFNGFVQEISCSNKFTPNFKQN